MLMQVARHLSMQSTESSEGMVLHISSRKKGRSSGLLHRFFVKNSPAPCLGHQMESSTACWKLPGESSSILMNQSGAKPFRRSGMDGSD
ncbi:MAG: hypothetical protein M2R45_05497 [Verrucomicrobia subdivision 3 bacterium]|nr:hypothetical protein [Limisphaerales bacterium]